MRNAKGIANRDNAKARAEALRPYLYLYSLPRREIVHGSIHFAH